ncbi:MAG TPA: response regulator [Stellaceae bacterium]|nr:response regulator [Stellaceae bacterium]
MSEGPIIYVVDDDEAVRDSLKVLLESYGMTVADFGSIAEFRRGRVVGRKACMILDLHLPGTSGLDYLASRDCASRLPVIMITGRGDDATRERAREMGARAFLDKPVSDEALLANIREAFGDA